MRGPSGSDIDEDLSFDQFVSDDETRHLQQVADSLQELLHYPFSYKDSVGENDPRFNHAERVDVIRDNKSRIVRSPIKFLEVLRFVESLRGQKPSIGLKYKVGTMVNYIHFLFEDVNEGWVFIDNKRMLQVRQIHKIEKILDYLGLDSVGLIANKIGLPARNEVHRINSQRGKIIDLHYYDTIHNTKLSEFF